METEKKLKEKYGDKCLDPYSEEELVRKAKEEFLPGYLKGKETTDEFKDFYYKNDIQEKIWKQIKEKSIEQYKEESKAFERDFPTLSPDAKPPKQGTSDSNKGAWKAVQVNCEKLGMLEKSFPSLDRGIIEFAFYQLCCQLPQTMSYLKACWPNDFVDIAKPKELEVKPQVVILPAARPKAFQLQQKYKKKEKSQFENPIPNILKQEESNPGAKYGEIRREADKYLKMMHIYLKNEAYAHSAGQHSEATRFKKLAEEYCNMYSEAKHKAMAETINQR